MMMSEVHFEAVFLLLKNIFSLWVWHLYHLVCIHIFFGFFSQKHKMASECPCWLITLVTIWVVEGFETPKTLPPLPIEILSSVDLKDSSKGTADNNYNKNEEDNNNDNKYNEEDYESKNNDDLPSYLIRLVNRLENIDLDYVREDSVKRGDGGDSDVEDDDCLDHDKAVVTDQAERNE